MPDWLPPASGSSKCRGTKGMEPSSCSRMRSATDGTSFSRAGRPPEPREKCLQQLSGLPVADAGDHLGMVMRAGAVEKPYAMVDGAGFWVPCPVGEPADAHMGHRARAHGAGFERDIEIAAVEPPGAARFQRSPDRQHFGVGGWIVELTHAVAGRGKHDAVLDNRGAHWRFACGRGLLR